MMRSQRVFQLVEEIGLLQAPTPPGLPDAGRQVGPGPQAAALDIAAPHQAERAEAEPEEQLQRIVGPVVPAPPATADRDEGVAVDAVVVGHEAEEMAADAVADMDDGQAGRGVDQGVRDARGRVDAPAARQHVSISMRWK